MIVYTGMQTCQSYTGCPVCTHEWTPGTLVSRKACVCDGYRRFLAPESRARRRRFQYKGKTYEYRNTERRLKPRYRDNNFVRKAVALSTKPRPFLGHKTAPLLARWPDYDWRRWNVPEIMHGTCVV